MEHDISELLGKNIVKIESTEFEIDFYTEDGFHYKMFHEQECCENVRIEDIMGNLQSLVGNKITMAEKVTDRSRIKPMDEDDHSYTWTFYKLATIKGYVTIRWYGTSNGYYGEEVSFGLYKNNEMGEEELEIVIEPIDLEYEE